MMSEHITFSHIDGDGLYVENSEMHSQIYIGQFSLRLNRKILLELLEAIQFRGLHQMSVHGAEIFIENFFTLRFLVNGTLAGQYRVRLESAERLRLFRVLGQLLNEHYSDRVIDEDEGGDE